MTAERRYGPRLRPPPAIRILQIGRFQIDHAWAFPGVRSAFWRLYANGASGASVRDDGGLHPLGPEQLVLVPAWHTFDTVGPGPTDGRIDHLFVHFDLPRLPPLADESDGVETEVGVIAVDLDDTRRGVLAQLCADLPPMLDPARDAHPDPVAILTGRSLVDLTLAAALAHSRPLAETFARSDAADAELGPALALVRRRVAAGEPPPDAAALAAACHVSERTILRRFREHLGKTPHRYVTDARLTRAAEALATTPDTIDAIATEAGYPDRQAFTRAFTRRFGLAPAAYRDMPLV